MRGCAASSYASGSAFCQSMVGSTPVKSGDVDGRCFNSAGQAAHSRWLVAAAALLALLAMFTL